MWYTDPMTFLSRPLVFASLLVALLVFVVHPAPTYAANASLKMSPNGGKFEVGGVFDVSLVLDTGGEAVNTIKAELTFPAQQLQVINPAASTSFITIWAVSPTYSNVDGTVSLQGGLPSPGIKTSSGVISTITFRVIAPGRASLRYKGSSLVLRNDGQGTNILTSTSGADFVLSIPPPAGPIVTSPTHPDLNQWYNDRQVQFSWEPVANAVGYSFIFDQNAKTNPGEVVNITQTSTQVQSTADGLWYFHIKAKTDLWGGTTHYPVKIDTTPPAAFTPKFDKGTLTPEDVGTLTFLTTDGASGIDRYEVKQVTKKSVSGTSDTLFVEANSPYLVSKLPEGEYDFIVRAIDRAGNTTAGNAGVKVVASGLPFYARVPFFRNAAVANAVILGLIILALAALVTIIVRRLRPRSTFRHDLTMLEHDAQKKYASLQAELQELQRAKTAVDQTFPPSPPNTPSGPPAPPSFPMR